MQRISLWGWRHRAMIALARPRPRRQLISLTPLIDVVFILLIFFMLASSFLNWHRVDLKLGGGSATSEVPKERLAVSIDEDGSVRLDNAPLSDAEFKEEIVLRLSNNANLPVRIRAANDVPLQRTVDIVALISAAGGKDVSFAEIKRRGE
jgi:biopolymer transport protein ExbD